MVYLGRISTELDMTHVNVMNPHLEITRPNVCLLAVMGFLVGVFIVEALW